MKKPSRPTTFPSRSTGDPLYRTSPYSVQAGEIFGLIGPNGAGKTTTIRMLLHILQPGAGEVSFFGLPLDGQARDRIGYLPEERSLYHQARIQEVLVYLGQLKGLSAPEAHRLAGEVLKQLGMAEHGQKRVSESSRGMGQLIQFDATVVQWPDLVILDEPSAGLDTVNVRRLKELVGGLQAQGVAVVFSTHRLASV